MEKKLFFQNSQGQKLAAILTDPSGDKEKPIIVLCHGFASSKESNTCKSIAEKLREKNISTFRFDFFAHGESEGKFEDLTVTEAIDDTMRAIEYLKGMGYKKIGLFGSSFGGLSSYFVAAKSEDIYILILKAPVASYAEFSAYTDRERVKKWKSTDYDVREGKKLKYDFYKDSMNHIAYDVAEKIKVPTLILHGNQDRDVPVEQSINITKYIQNCALEIVVGADHRFTKKEDFDQMLNSILTFVIAHSA